ncbi:iron complex transport system ATP-binding protein [Comamonas sp. BIGb0124]|uniref:ABC transporter ATP-binding protein n=1 Tax=Comamonas sp. BIGb0124 TaxID=2485130 RepID=UPI000F47873D|nr:ABC transporter ATP-binding protein [Comamonas sp. BIGb0124]ROR24276.1 iron complex transport system ATP-binding protein [Comamonas sp. BIGb0124]
MKPTTPSPSDRGALAAHDLSIRLAGRDIVHAADLRLPAGRWTAMVGPNGSGKSTLLKALAGLLPARRGGVELLGRPLNDWNGRERARTLAWLGQDEAVSAELHVRDIVMLGRLPHQGWLGRPGDGDAHAVSRAMVLAGCEALADRLFSTLSGGERQRVLLARVLAVQAEVMLMDEPLTNLDPPHQADWVKLVRGLRDAGTTLLTVLHELGAALQADDLLLVRNGQVLHHGAVAEAATRQCLIDVFDGRIELHAVNGHWLVLPH